ncbi:MAG: sugar ABC transporter ATP-binding protein [Solirubrobacteraceae bacterium]
MSLELEAGRIHGLVGENGAGKSTILKIISGAQVPTSGAIEMGREQVVFHHPIGARRMGVVAVHQELTILPGLTAMANVFLGQEPRRLRVMLDMSTMRRRFQALCERLSVEIAPGRLAGSLSLADQQSLEIMRGLEAEAKLLLLDEPTASLAVVEREALYANLRRLRDAGIAIMLISHDLDEVLALCDTVTVMRNGREVASSSVADWSKTGLMTAMLGRRPAQARRRRADRGLGRAEALRVESVTVPGRVEAVSFTAQAGEILGIAGLVGAGRTEVLRAISGLEPRSSGRMWVGGREVRWPRRPRAAQRLGLALAPEDRKTQGLVLLLPAYANVTLTAPWKCARAGVLSPRGERRHAAELMDGLGFDRARIGAATRTLSGGNQQKLVLSKWIATNTPVLLVDEPTRGIDIGAKAEIFETLERLAEAGTTIVLVSSELEEVFDHSDRVIVMARGSVIAELPGLHATADDALRLIFDAEEASP